MIGSVTNCVCAIVTICLLHQSVSWLRSRFPKFGAVIDGVPLVLLKYGEWQQEAMRGLRVEQADVMAAARTKGVKDLGGIKYAVLERNGSISIIKASQGQ